MIVYVLFIIAWDGQLHADSVYDSERECTEARRNSPASGAGCVKRVVYSEPRSAR